MNTIKNIFLAVVSYLLFATDRIANVLNPFVKLEDLEEWNANPKNYVISLFRVILTISIAMIVKLTIEIFR